MNKRILLFLAAGGLLSLAAFSTGCDDGCGNASDGASCSDVGAECPAGDSPFLRCEADSKWHEIGYYDGDGGDCFAFSQKLCPEAMPLPGSACEPCEYVATCSYSASTACGGAKDLYCADDSTWHVKDQSPEIVSCDCSLHTEAQKCNADPYCRFLNPGCNDGLPTDGCHPQVECEDDTVCAAGTKCTAAGDYQCNAGQCVCQTVHRCL
ncbi:MAG: hypothetical protein U0441_01040 [Polyangiaceae bacterium]